jgi:hypothetical protein
MNIEKLFTEIHSFSEETHGSTDYHKDEIFVQGNDEKSFAPLKYLSKKLDLVDDPRSLTSEGFVFDSYDLFGQEEFQSWFERQFSRKLTRALAKNISILHLPNNQKILSAIAQVNEGYETLRRSQILMNGKNLPVQLGEWYAKSIFGLKQHKSPSQRGFDFYIKDKRVEVKVHWNDHSSPKGVKLRKSLLELSDYCIVMYISKNFMIREVCFLDSSFVLRKFAGKGHTVFLKDVDVSNYFFSKSSKHADKVANSTALLKYASPSLAMNVAEHFQ